MKERDAARVKACRSRKIDNWNTYRKLQNKVNNAKRLEKKNHYNTVFFNVKGDTKGTWKKLKELVPTKSTT